MTFLIAWKLSTCRLAICSYHCSTLCLASHNMNFCDKPRHLSFSESFDILRSTWSTLFYVHKIHCMDCIEPFPIWSALCVASLDHWTITLQVAFHSLFLCTVNTVQCGITRYQFTPNTGCPLCKWLHESKPYREVATPLPDTYQVKIKTRTFGALSQTFCELRKKLMGKALQGRGLGW